MCSGAVAEGFVVDIQEARRFPQHLSGSHDCSLGTAALGTGGERPFGTESALV
jgi:hypothetical protein